MTTRFISTAIPYVNAAPHLGFAMELVIADAIARHERLRGGDTYFLSGTDDNSVKNALAAEAAGVPTRVFVAERTAEFAALKELLNLSYDDFLRTSADPCHAPAVPRLWIACLANARAKTCYASCGPWSATSRGRSHSSGSAKASTSNRVVKLTGALLSIERTELHIEALGFNGVGWEGDAFTHDELSATRNSLRQKSATIAGGTAEIQLNIIAKRVLGLPD